MKAGNTSEDELESNVAEPEDTEGEESQEEQAEVEKDPMELLQEELQQKENELAEQQNEFLRYQAETENFKKRLRKEKEDFLQYANEKLLKSLIPIHDNLERALSTTKPSVKILKKGLEMILKQFADFLEKEKVEPIQAMGEKFDPSLHEIMTQMESDEHEENTVIQEYSKGYMLNGRVIRPAQVVTSKLPAKKKAKSETPSEDEQDCNEDE